MREQCLSLCIESHERLVPGAMVHRDVFLGMRHAGTVGSFFVSEDALYEAVSVTQQNTSNAGYLNDVSTESDQHPAWRKFDVHVRSEWWLASSEERDR